MLLNDGSLIFTKKLFLEVTIWLNLLTTDVGINVGTNVGINVGINLTQQKILSEIMNNPKVKVDEMAERIRLKSRTIERAIRALKGKGILEREGSNKTGYWKVKA